jgi:hypothetical protein
LALIHTDRAGNALRVIRRDGRQAEISPDFGMNFIRNF